jgi:hypothetical protein
MSNPQSTIQPRLFDFSDSTSDVAELFPDVWGALECLTSPSVDVRLNGLRRLIELDAHRLSPLVAYVLVTHLDDQNIEFRFELVQALGSLLSRGDRSADTPEGVKQSIKTYLSQMRRRKIYALLQVAEHHPSAQSNVAALLKGCSNAGKVLADIFSDRKIPVVIRRQAIHFVGIVGFLDAVPRLERLAERLVARMNGQRLMPFAPPTDSAEKTLLPTIQTALTVLGFP